MQKWEYLKVKINHRINDVDIWPPDTFDQEWLLNFVGQLIDIKPGRELQVHDGWLQVRPNYLLGSTDQAKRSGFAAAFLRYLGEQGWEAIVDTGSIMTLKRPIED